MNSIPAYQALARAFVLEGTDTHFTLMGDGNMHWVSALASEPGVRTFYVRHEHCACSMAMAYALAARKVGVASVTCGPGLTQTMTALATAAHARIPLVLFAGEAPLGANFYNQRIDQAPFAVAAGARYIAAHSQSRLLDCVREAFYVARTESMPVVLGVPYDVQTQLVPTCSDYLPSYAVLPDTGVLFPNPDYVEKAVHLIAKSQRVVVLGGRGVKHSGAQPECEQLAEVCDGLLATTLPTLGMFDSNPFSLGVAGGFASEITREKFAEADLIVAVGASLTHFTADGGKLYPSASVIQIDTDPRGLKHGRRAADIYVKADAKIALQAILESLRSRKTIRSGWRTMELARRIADDPADSTPFDNEPGLLDPRDAIAALDRILPREWEIVSGSGHSSAFTAQMRRRKTENFHTIREFGAIGNGLSYAVGVAAARSDNTVVLIEGDGGFLMHAQELETIRRHNLRILICILNDGAYGAEIHKLRADGVDESGAIFGRGDLGKIARGFGLRGTVITDAAALEGMLDGFQRADITELWDIHISERVVSSVMRRVHPAKRGDHSPHKQAPRPVVTRK